MGNMTHLERVSFRFSGCIHWECVFFYFFSPAQKPLWAILSLSILQQFGKESRTEIVTIWVGLPTIEPNRPISLRATAIECEGASNYSFLRWITFVRNKIIFIQCERHLLKIITSTILSNGSNGRQIQRPIIQCATFLKHSRHFFGRMHKATFISVDQSVFHQLYWLWRFWWSVWNSLKHFSIKKSAVLYSSNDNIYASRFRSYAEEIKKLAI